MLRVGSDYCRHRSRPIPSPPFHSGKGKRLPLRGRPPSCFGRSGLSRFTRFAPCARLHSLPLAGRLLAGRVVVSSSPWHRGRTTTLLRCALRVMVLPLHRLQAMSLRKRFRYGRSSLSPSLHRWLQGIAFRLSARGIPCPISPLMGLRAAYPRRWASGFCIPVPSADACPSCSTSFRPGPGAGLHHLQPRPLHKRFRYGRSSLTPFAPPLLRAGSSGSVPARWPGTQGYHPQKTIA